MNQSKSKLLRAVAQVAAPGGMGAFYKRLKRSYSELSGPERSAYEKRAKVFLAQRGVVLQAEGGGK